MRTKILVTAVAGSGKSTICRALQELGYSALDIESIPGLFELVHEDTGEPMIKHDAGNLELVAQGDWNCKVDELQSLLQKQTDDVTYYCGAMSNIKEVRHLFDKVIVLRVSDETTLKRLSTRKVGEFGRTDEIRQWVLSWKSEIEEEWIAAGGIAVSAEGKPDEVAQLVVVATDSR
ncbi:MAG: AAA family ATPase [Candidatus Saccharimonadales bacterium]